MNEQETALAEKILNTGEGSFLAGEYESLANAYYALVKAAALRRLLSVMSDEGIAGIVDAYEKKKAEKSPPQPPPQPAPIRRSDA